MVECGGLEDGGPKMIFPVTCSGRGEGLKERPCWCWFSFCLFKCSPQCLFLCWGSIYTEKWPYSDGVGPPAPA